MTVWVRNGWAGLQKEQGPEDRILKTSRQKGGGARTPMLGYSLNSAGR